MERERTLKTGSFLSKWSERRREKNDPNKVKVVGQESAIIRRRREREPVMERKKDHHHQERRKGKMRDERERQRMERERFFPCPEKLKGGGMEKRIVKLEFTSRIR